MTPIFLDTVGLLALWDADDQWHGQANAAFPKLLSQKSTFITTAFVLLECGNAAARRTFRKDENEMLRTRVPKKRIFLKHEERELLLKLGAAIGPGASKLITIVHRRTYQRWIREKTSGKKPSKMGRPRTLESVREIIVRLARQTGWGYGRIFGELKKLRIHSVSQSTVANILKEEGVRPRPKRGSGTWDEFLKLHVDTLWQVDFFSKMICDANWFATSICVGVYSSFPTIMRTRRLVPTVRGTQKPRTSTGSG